MEVSNSNISNLFACLSNINDKFENKIVKVQESIIANNYTKEEIDKIKENVSQQIENLDQIINNFSSTVDDKIDDKFTNEITEQLQGKIDDKFNEKLDSVISSKLESNFDSIINTKINDNNQIINNSISKIGDLLNFGSDTSKVYSKEEANQLFLDKSTAGSKFDDLNTKIDANIYSKEEANQLFLDKSTAGSKFDDLNTKIDANIYSKEEANQLFLDKSTAKNTFEGINTKLSTIDDKFDELNINLVSKAETKNVYSKEDIDQLLENKYLNLTDAGEKFDELNSKIETTKIETNKLLEKLDSEIIDNYFDKTTIESKLSSKAETENVYSKADMNNLLKTDYLNKLAIETKFGEISSKIDLNQSSINSLVINNKSELEGKINLKSDIENVYTKKDIDDKLKLKVDTDVLDNYLDSDSISTKLQNYCLKTNLNTDISELQKIKDIEGLITNNKSELRGLIDSNKSEINKHETSISNFSDILNFENNSISKVYSKDQINDLLNDEYVKLEDLNTEIENLQNSIKSIASEESIKLFNENFQGFNNRVGDLEAQISYKANSSDVNDLLSNKLDKLVDDEYIKLSNLNDKLSEQQKINDLSSLIDTKANSEDVYTITNVNDLLKNKLDVSKINDYPKRTEIESIKTELSNSIQAINNILDFENENSKVYSKEQVDEKISDGFKSLFDRGWASINPINTKIKLDVSTVTSIGTSKIDNISIYCRNILSNTISRIYGTLYISKDATTQNSSVVETSVGKESGQAGIVSLGVKLTYYYTLDEIKNNSAPNYTEKNLGIIPLNFHITSITKGSVDTSQVEIYFEGYKFGYFLGTSTKPTADYLILDFQYYSANYTNGILKWRINNCDLETYKLR